LVPRVVGMSIPRSSDMKAWSIFALAHFKPFSTSHQFLNEYESTVEAFQAYNFSPRSQKVMHNWESIHECEDEHD
ncbi:hypothetical protein EV424DRAFT_1297900, partial [Suillus variegatus]